MNQERVLFQSNSNRSVPTPYEGFAYPVEIPHGFEVLTSTGSVNPVKATEFFDEINDIITAFVADLHATKE